MIKIVPAKQVVDELKALGFQQVIDPRDTKYSCPDPGWLGQFGDYCRLNQPAKPSSGETGDCDDAAFWAVVEAGKAARENADFTGPGYAFDYCRVNIPLVPVGHEDDWDGAENTLNGIPTTSRHETDVVRCSNDTWFFFEPQTGLWVGCRDAIDAGRVGDRLLVLP